MRTEETMTAEKMRRKSFVTLLGIAKNADSQSKLDRSLFAQIVAFSTRSACMTPRTLSASSNRRRSIKTNSVVGLRNFRIQPPAEVTNSPP